MENGKEKKPTEKVSKDSLWEGSATGSDVGNRLALPAELKNYLNAQDMDFRFLNASEFRAAGNYHKSDWRPFDARNAKSLKGNFNANAEGLISRGDLILGIRPKAVTAKHKGLINRRNVAYANFSKTEAKALKDQAKASGLGDKVTVTEGYEEDSKGYQSPDT